jgi:transcription-repair coupling factor (superfamily II helicase)
VIGTSIGQQNVVFKDLGLLIVDEEQKICQRKGQLKTIAANVDTLTLTQRQFREPCSFSQWQRDLSVITTPPPNRYPIETNVAERVKGYSGCDFV